MILPYMKALKQMIRRMFIINICYFHRNQWISHFLYDLNFQKDLYTASKGEFLRIYSLYSSIYSQTSVKHNLPSKAQLNHPIESRAFGIHCQNIRDRTIQSMHPKKIPLVNAVHESSGIIHIVKKMSCHRLL